MQALGRAARAAVSSLSTSSTEQRQQALRSASAALRRNVNDLLLANRKDLDAAHDLSVSMRDRLMLDPSRIEAMAAGLEVIATLPDPIGRVMAEWSRPNGLLIQRVAVPLGVIGIIYESRPNVTADAAALCLMSGNAAILRGGSESFHSSAAIHKCIVDGIADAGLPEASVQILPTRDRDAVGFLLSSMGEWVDVVVPRGGRNLIRRVQDEARVPVIGHLEGICHVYLHAAADPDMAREIVVNAKLRRTGICGAAETLLVDRAAAATLLPVVCGALSERGCAIRGDEEVLRHVADAVPASESDWSAEYLDAIIAVRVVADLDAAVAHIAQYGSGHTESIVTADAAAADAFLNAVDSAIVLHNASTQFADGGEFGMGAEIGIATGRIHARGPVGVEQLTSYKYVVRGNGQVRA